MTILKENIQNYLERILVVASPKSPILTWSFESRKIFTGFRSRWIMPCWWMWARPSTISLNNRHTLSSSLNKPLSIAVLQQSTVSSYVTCQKQPSFTITMGIENGRLQFIPGCTYIPLVQHSGTWLKSQMKMDTIIEISVIFFSLPRTCRDSTFNKSPEWVLSCSFHFRVLPDNDQTSLARWRVMHQTSSSLRWMQWNKLHIQSTAG